MAVVHDTDIDALSAEEQVEFLALCARVEGHVAARRVQTVAAIAGRGVDPEPYVEAEVAIATRTPIGAAITEVHRAHRIARMLPGSLAAASSGDLHPRQLRTLHDLTDGVEDPQVCRAVEERVLPRACRQTAAQLARSINRAVADLDPGAFARAHETRRRSADVTLTPVEASMAYLTAYLPLHDGAALMQHIESSARAAKAGGDKRPLGMLRVEALLDGGAASTVSSGNGSLAGGGHTAHGRPVELHVVATVDTMLGLADTHGELPGLGPVPADTIREMARDAALRWVTITDAGQVMSYGHKTYRPSTQLAAAVAATWVSSAGPGSTIPATRCDLDHLTPYPQGRTTAANLAPLDRRWHRAKTHAGITVKRQADGILEWTTPRGQRVVVDPYDYRLGP